MLPECPIDELPMVPHPVGQSTRWRCPECGAICTIPGGLYRQAPPAPAPKSEQAQALGKLPNMHVTQAKMLVTKAETAEKEGSE